MSRECFHQRFDDHQSGHYKIKLLTKFILKCVESKNRKDWRASYFHDTPILQIYRQIGEKYGVEYSEAEILNRYRWAYEQPWGRSRLR